MVYLIMITPNLFHRKSKITGSYGVVLWPYESLKVLQESILGKPF